MKNPQAIRRTGNRTRGFTLIELLVAMTVLGILASIVYGAMESVRNSARVQKTISTISKLDRLIMAKYNSYKTRRIQVEWPTTMRADQINALKPREVALVRLSLIRDLMRWEMPDRPTDFTRTQASTANPCMLHFVPALALRYKANLSGATAKNTDYLQAECLYQIVSAIPGGLEQFRDDEIGDYDKDGLREFHDAWGNPILFFRWPAGYVAAFGADSALQSGDPVKDPDQFDPMKAGGNNYALYPLIMSGGPDGVIDIQAGGDNPINTSGNYQFTDPYKPSPRVAQPNAAPGFYDNITNHRLPTP